MVEKEMSWKDVFREYLLRLLFFFDENNVKRKVQSTMVQNNQDVSTGPLSRPFVGSLAPLTHLLASHCSRSAQCALCYAHSVPHCSSTSKRVGQWRINAGTSGCSGPWCRVERK